MKVVSLMSELLTIFAKKIFLVVGFFSFSNQNKANQRSYPMIAKRGEFRKIQKIEFVKKS
jgi:hypothetical protein